MSVIIETQPLAEPVSVAEVQAELRLTTDTDSEMIMTHIAAARQIGERITRQSLCYKGYVQYFDGFPSPANPMRLAVPPVIAVSSIKYLDMDLVQQTWDPSEYFLANKQSPALIVAKPSNVYPAAASVPGSVEVHMTCGFSTDGYGDITRTLEPELKLAIIKLAAHFYDHPEATSQDLQNVVPENYLSVFRSNRIYVF